MAEAPNRWLVLVGEFHADGMATAAAAGGGDGWA